MEELLVADDPRNIRKQGSQGDTRQSDADPATLRRDPANPARRLRSSPIGETGAELGERTLRSVTVVPYAQPFTYDILPDSSTGTYFTAGALMGSTLF